MAYALGEGRQLLRPSYTPQALARAAGSEGSSMNGASHCSPVFSSSAHWQPCKSPRSVGRGQEREYPTSKKRPSSLRQTPHAPLLSQSCSRSHSRYGGGAGGGEGGGIGGSGGNGGGGAAADAQAQARRQHGADRGGQALLSARQAEADARHARRRRRERVGRGPRAARAVQLLGRARDGLHLRADADGERHPRAGGAPRRPPRARAAARGAPLSPPPRRRSGRALALHGRDARPDRGRRGRAAARRLCGGGRLRGAEDAEPLRGARAARRQRARRPQAQQPDDPRQHRSRSPFRQRLGRRWLHWLRLGRRRPATDGHLHRLRARRGSLPRVRPVQALPHLGPPLAQEHARVPPRLPPLPRRGGPAARGPAADSSREERPPRDPRRGARLRAAHLARGGRLLLLRDGDLPGQGTRVAAPRARPVGVVPRLGALGRAGRARDARAARREASEASAAEPKGTRMGRPRRDRAALPAAARTESGRRGGLTGRAWTGRLLAAGAAACCRRASRESREPSGQGWPYRCVYSTGVRRCRTGPI
mmetsp:Transcript_26038/g.85440  ORF Transcript_26038/g.85440 Transcript_26038/m.85440 type:complete len:537 (-) Transcript_26038:188-1798(-)